MRPLFFKAFAEEILHHANRLRFEWIAKSYETQVTGAQYRYREPEFCASRAAPFVGSGAEVLDLGCGTGLVGRSLRKFCLRTFKLTGIDYSFQMLSELSHNTNAYQSVLQVDLLAQLPMDIRNKFDVVIASSVVQFFPDMNRFLEICEKLCVPSGLVIFSFDLGRRRSSLNRSGYFCHSRSAAEIALRERNFVTLDFTEHLLRKEPRRGEVYGAVVVAKCP